MSIERPAPMRIARIQTRFATAVAAQHTAPAARLPRALLALAAIFVCALTATTWAARAQAAETAASLGTTFAPNRLGAKAAFHFSIHYAGGEGGVPSPVRRATIHFPVGVRMDIPKLQACSRAQLQAHGVHGCPARSQIGSGHAVADVRVGSEVETEQASVWVFLGPFQNGDPTIQVLGQGYSPLDQRVVMTGTVLPDHAPYGEEIVMNIPPIPTLPLEPDASPLSLTLTIGGSMHAGKRGTDWVVLPSHCPTGGFPFAAEFGYADGTSSNSTATAPCP